MIREGGSGRLTRFGLALVACTTLAVTLLPTTVGRSPAAEAQSSPYQVTVTPTIEITDGRQLTINVKTSDGVDHPIYQAQAYVCRAGVDFPQGGADVPDLSTRQGGPHCPPTGLSTSAQPNAVSNRTFKFAPTPEGENLFLRVGTGVVQWPDTTNGNVTTQLTCDESNPCVLLVQLYIGSAWLPFSFDLDFKASDAIASCGGAAPGVLESAGSDALSDAWVDWTVTACSAAGSGAWTTFALGEETAAVRRFANREIDIAYTGLGYNEEAGMLDNVQGEPRPAVAVPIGLSAATLALGNGWLDPDSRKLPFSQASLTLDETATLLSGGEFFFRPLTSVGARNPELAGDGIMIISDRALKIGAPAEAGVTTWALTRHFDTLRPDLWKVPDSPIFPDPGAPRGIDLSFPLASPSYANVLTTLTGRPALARSVGSLPPEAGGTWVFTDLTTAEAFDLAPVAIENAAGTFVAPNNDTMSSAVSAMETLPSGMRVPNPSSTDGYPLTYVIYAMVPAQPLADETGACRTDSQQLLADWMTYVVRDGQSNLPTGMAPLTDDLKAEAEARLQEIGKTPGVECPVPEIPGPDGTVPPAVAPPSLAPSAPVAASGGRGAGPAVPVSTGDDLVEQANAELTLSEDDENPGFLGGALPSVLAAMGALLAVGGLTAVAARQTGNRALPPGPQMTRLPDPPIEPTS